MWISVVLIILVIVIGLIAGSRLSAPGPQRRAVNASFISLAIMAGLFFILINAFPGDWIVPFFTVACIVVPICIYVGFTRAAVSAEKAAKKKSFEIPRAVASWEHEDIPATPKATPSVSAASAKAATATAPAPVAEKPKTEAPIPKPAKAAPAKAKTPAEAPAKVVKAEEKPQQKPAAKQAAPVEAKPEPKPATKPEPKPEPKSAAKAEPKAPKAAEPTATLKAEKPVEKVAPAKVEKPAEAPEKVAEPAPAPAPAPIPAPEPKAAPKVAEDIQASLTAKGLQPAAAKEPAPEFTAAASADLLTGKPPASEEASAHKSLLSEIEALVERDLNIGRKIAEGATEEEVRAAEAAPLTYHDNRDVQLPSSLHVPETTKETSAHKPKLEPKSEPLDPFTEFCSKAASLRDQGSYAVAAVIFKKAADSAPSAKDARTTQFDELSCYVKAGDTTKAKALAAQLRQSSVLTRFERIKLDAVERMG